QAVVPRGTRPGGSRWAAGGARSRTVPALAGGRGPGAVGAGGARRVVGALSSAGGARGAPRRRGRAAAVGLRLAGLPVGAGLPGAAPGRLRSLPRLDPVRRLPDLLGRRSARDPV